MKRYFSLIFLVVFGLVFLTGAGFGYLGSTALQQRTQENARIAIPPELAASPLAQLWNTTIVEATVVSVSTSAISIEEQGRELTIPLLSGERSAGVDRVDEEGNFMLEAMQPSDIPVGSRVSITVSFVDAETFWVSRVLVK